MKWVEGTSPEMADEMGGRNIPEMADEMGGRNIPTCG